ncbi:MAG: aminoacetone oxidase family FAD-binding enzyme [Clostridiales bacterium]|nr:aminoacetone oxidase family FAD-binding enzyme [Clostridiales bacterium]
MVQAYDILVIGGGASGLAAAIAAGRGIAGRRPPASILILERLDRVGKKLLVTGNGRCNITNRDVSPAKFHTVRPEIAEAVLRTLSPRQTAAFFAELGVLFRFDETGRAYPYSLQASSVLDALRAGAAEAGALTRCGCRVTSIRPRGGGFLVEAEERAGPGRYAARRVILAAGGSAAPKLGSDGGGCRLLEALGHIVLPETPAIVQLKTDSTYTRPLKGIKVEGSATLYIDGKKERAEAGEILFTDYGLSGPPILQISRAAVRAGKGRRAEVSVDCMPDYPFHRVCALLSNRAARRPACPLEDYFTGLLHKRVGQTLFKACGLSLRDPAGGLTQVQWKAVASKVKDFRFRVTGHTGWANAQTTAGGLDLAGFSPSGLESRKVKGLYACGEALDVDGDCGGYNLQWAWASGLLAGRSAADSLLKA